MNKINKTVFVGVSGGVDSSVSVALLKDQGYDVVGVFIRTWTPDFIKCTWQDERRDAMRVCAHLGIPFLECDAEEEYKKGVADYMILEYKKGNTPNPDVMCNREVKFGVFWNFAKAHGADFIATGHYAINNYELGTCHDARRVKNYELKKGVDASKDQSYFLWTLNQDDLVHVLFPIGHLKKTEVRKLANKYKIPVAEKKDSQGVCFLGPLDMKDFLKHYIKSEKGDVLDEKGDIIGTHDGAVFFTLGERHGFTITQKSEKEEPLYIISKNIEKNTITVTTRQPTRQDLGGSNKVKINNVNWILNVPENEKRPASPTSQGGYQVQIRYHGELLSCRIEVKGQNEAKIIFEKEVLVDKGQSIVIYDDDVCLGGGIVE
ncbi:MAG: tRNA 2-thiouridine(34) synthase MnmA [Candidatus Paceibacterota bacterium]|jgi:tRNA-specific 2-thiouridylase